MATCLTDRDYWDRLWNTKLKQMPKQPDPHAGRLLARFLPKSENMTLTEVGCASGNWLAFFHRVLRYRVSGIEYVEGVAVSTREKLQTMGIPCEIVIADFFDYVKTTNRFDVVFSGGFIEHFEDTSNVVSSLCSLSNEYVVSSVPNLYGVNGLISKWIRPAVYHAHVPISRELLRRVHEECGMKTIFCDYVGGLKLIRPGWGTPFFEKHRLAAFAVNVLPGVFNLVSQTTSRMTRVWPRTPLLSPGLLYVGRKQ
jgi:SAM-dependent methyltransferase